MTSHTQTSHNTRRQHTGLRGYGLGVNLGLTLIHTRRHHTTHTQDEQRVHTDSRAKCRRAAGGHARHHGVGPDTGGGGETAEDREGRRRCLRCSRRGGRSCTYHLRSTRRRRTSTILHQPSVKT